MSVRHANLALSIVSSEQQYRYNRVRVKLRYSTSVRSRVLKFFSISTSNKSERTCNFDTCEKKKTPKIAIVHFASRRLHLGKHIIPGYLKSNKQKTSFSQTRRQYGTQTLVQARVAEVKLLGLNSRLPDFHPHKMYECKLCSVLRRSIRRDVIST